MVAPGNVAVGRSGGVILAKRPVSSRISAGRAVHVSQQDHMNAADGITDRTHPLGPWPAVNGSIMRRAFAIAVASISLAGCSSFSTSSWNYFKSDPVPIKVQLESTPPGADARVSIGGGCKTPCSVNVTPPEGSTSFLVNYSMTGRQPAGVPVQIVKESGGMFSSDTVRLSPNPVVAELQPVGPPPAPAKPMRPKRKKPAAAPADDAAPAQ